MTIYQNGIFYRNQLSGPKKGRFLSKVFNKTFTWQPCQSSLAEEQPGYLAKHLPVRWLHQTRACSIPRRCGWRVEDDGE